MNVGALAELEDFVSGLNAEEKSQLDTMLEKERHALWLPEPENKPQVAAFVSLADLLLFGGAAGGGKTSILCGLALTEHTRSVIFRAQATDLRGIEEMLIEIGGREGWNGQRYTYRKKGHFVELGHLGRPGSELSWMGRPHDFIGFDEGAQLSRTKVQFVMGWLRSIKKGQRKRIVIASNPPTGGEGLWLLEWFAPWLDPKYPNPAKPGELRWAVTSNDREATTIWLPDNRPIILLKDREWRHATEDEIASKNENVIEPLSRTFIPSLLSDNPHLAQTGYRARLQALPEPLRSQLLNGSFLAGQEDHLWQVIPTAWVKAAMDRWTPEPPNNAMMSAIAADVAQGGCFDDKTEILTDSGWKLFESLTGRERVLSLDGDNATWGKITQLHKYAHNGPLNVCEGRSLDFAITDNHNLIVRSHPTSSKYVLRRYDELPTNFIIRRTNGWVGSNPDTITFDSVCQMPHGGERRYEWKFSFIDWARFLGWFISEGCAFQEKRKNGRWRVNIAQKRGKKFDRIYDLLTKMGIKFYLQSSRSAVEFTISSISQHLIEHCGVHAANKKIPKYLKEATPEIMLAFLEEFSLGDGSLTKTGTHVLATSSIQLRDDLQEMLTKLGVAGKYVLSQKAGSSFKIGNRLVVRKRDTWNINWRKASTDKWVRKRDVLRVPYEGYVYCVSTPTQTICVRRNGIMMWSGNSDASTLARRHGPWFAPIIKRPGVETPKPSDVAGMVVTNRRNNAVVIVDMGGGYGGGVKERLEDNGIEVRGYNGANETTERTKDKSLAFYNKRAESMWRFREALDPDQDGGSPIALPNDPELLGDLTAPRWRLLARGIQVESKEDLREPERLGRSPDKGDAVIMAWSEGERALVAAQRKRDRKKPVVPAASSGQTDGTGWLRG